MGAAGLGLLALSLAPASASAGHAATSSSGHGWGKVASPIQHVVVIFQENISYDHYFATYPKAANIPGETQQGTGRPATTFTAEPNTPRTNNLANAGLLAPNNPNTVQPFRLTPGQAVTCDQDHDYTAEQKAFDGGRMDKFVEYTSRDACAPGQYGRTGLTMGYYDGNTVTGLWNYAQNYAMSDNSYSTTFGPSTPGALNLISGQTHGVRSYDPVTRRPTATPDPYTVKFPNAQGVGTVTGDPDPVWDDCSSTKYPVAGLDGKNVGDLLNAQQVTWGWFQDGFRPTVPATGTTRAVCGDKHTNVAGVSSTDYNPHHEPFQYYKSTANPKHLPPSSTAMIGKTDQANHQYDITDFAKVVNSDAMPAVSFLKAPNYQDGHAAYSDPLDEQKFVAQQVNAIQKSKNWKNTLVVLAYDDSDGWYDHQMATLTNSSNTTDDAAVCTDAYAKGVPMHGGYVDRCGPGTRQPLLLISPYAKSNYVDHTQTDQSSILRFIEDNWGLGRIGDSSADGWANPITGMLHLPNPKAPQVILNPDTGAVVSTSKR
ncbi:alkaline phosphatase family protein [Calidifontibacter sp. DB0510]|uniref:Alkaline phosphatase family protein n=1 Tax=Metallococcus carri TaxID=1656884 RepID=A0A967B2K8_9MICO|nr:alkaline phosphatase family protein [Metallococcus carri]NOP38054.1 alkaline phosphatase family protein [Calidifontibacter sp. DB2511S]